MIIKFNDLDEFLAEMEEDRDEITRGIVRVTTLREANRTAPNLYFYSVIATYRRGDEIVRLDRFCGNYWPRVDPEGNEKTRKNIEDIYGVLEERIKALNLEMRAGVYSLSEEERSK